MSKSPALYSQAGDFLVQTAPQHGASQDRVLRLTNAEVVGIALDHQFIYWAELNAKTGDPARIMRARRDGHDTTQLAGGLLSPGGLVLMQGYLYWLDLNGISRIGTDGRHLQRAFIPLPVDESGGSADGLASDGRYLYFSRCLASAIGRVVPTGAQPELNFVNLPSKECPQGLAVGGRYLYWAEVGGNSESPGFIGRATLQDGQAESQWLTVDDGGPFDLAADAHDVIWTSGGYADDPTQVSAADSTSKARRALFAASNAGGLLLSTA